MTRNARVDWNSDFQQIALPIDRALGEHVLQRVRLEADSELDAWYELYLVVTPSGFLIEKHSGSARGCGRQKETWFRRTLPEAKRKYSQILGCKLNQNRCSSRNDKVVTDESQKQQKLFG
ncbi:MAG: hypothetical protein P4L44_09645 [Oryzomonas sp.]|uniref:hypothetical protein n=1 Tax=Oryzomonas sp. TaxID=2855186 RepID=UPI002846771A|nr:hypothetical protein [Oryzomonas sp.]MDR3580211.1 hypothetical protein [Oryzomonas sp.]